MRPKAVVYFEWLILGTLALGIVQSYLEWDSLIALAGATQSNPAAFVLLTQALTIALIVALTLLVSRWHSRVAMWISIVLFAIGIPSVFALAAHGRLAGTHFITVLQTFGQLVAYGLLFTPEAWAWMKAGASSRPGVMR